MSPLYPYNAEACLQLTELLVAVQAALTCVECLYHNRPYRPGGLLDWTLYSSARPLFTSAPWRRKLFNGLFDYPAVLLLFGFRLLVALTVIFCVYADRPHAVAIILLCFSGLLTSMRNGYSDNGSDQLANIILVVLSINIATGNAGFPRSLSIFFIAFQGSLAYFTAGFLKALNGDWRNGRHLEGVMSTGFFGHRVFKYMLDGLPLSYVTLSVCLIAWEMTMGASPFLPPAVCAAVLAGGFLFHLSVAVVMGFNTFFWAFLATYPAIFFVSCKLY